MSSLSLGVGENKKILVKMKLETKEVSCSTSFVSNFIFTKIFLFLSFFFISLREPSSILHDTFLKVDEQTDLSLLLFTGGGG